MKAQLLAIALFLIAASVSASTLTTPSYRIQIEGSGEYLVSCDTVKYIGVSRKTGKSIRLSGRTVHTVGADGITPSHFLGYEFKNGRTRYFVGEDGELRVTRGSKVLLQETGLWEW
jgi:hypothetical protein